MPDEKDPESGDAQASRASKDTNKDKVEKCIVGSCNKFYHLECLKANPNVDFYINNKKINRFRCPHHYCSGCGISGNSVQILQCVECPTSYHLKCFRADRFAIKLTKKFILCGKHSYLKKNKQAALRQG
jgi:chromodomain-helicase-DNA-binding protein 7